VRGADHRTNPSNFKVRDVSKPGPGAGDRRRVCRHPVVYQDASLGWWLESEFKSTPVRLVDLSLNGCLIELARAPHLSAQQSIWLHAHSLAVAEWTEGRIVSSKKTWAGKCRLGIAFLAPMAYEPFKKLIYGREHFQESPPDDLPEHERDHFWK
jgi:hypothetical protein